MTLLTPVDLLDPRSLGPVHFIAIGGAGMSGIAAAYADLGVRVSGSDQADSANLAMLRGHGVTTYVGHDAGQLGDAETVVVSSAVRESNPELAEARSRGLRVWHRSAALGALMLGRPGVAVGGTHGKTTTSAMIAHVLTACGTDGGYVVGAPLATGESSRLGAPGSPFVVEADESDGSFLQYPAALRVVTNVEADHLDNWGTPEAYAEGFARFAAGADGEAVVDIDDAGGAALAAALGSHPLVTYGTSPDADVRITDVSHDAAGVRGTILLAGVPVTLALGVPGLHNLANATAALVVAARLGIDPQQAATALAGFHGAHRRFEAVGEVGGVRVVDDYAHHPTEIDAVLAAARDSVGEGRVIACFQPHLYSRTRDFATGFGEALAAADEVVLLDIYGAREEPMPGVTSALIGDVTTARLGPGRVHAASSLQDAAVVLAGLARPGDIVLTVGAGDVTTVGPLVVRALAGVGR
ncbi:UDP-N-acetylmuramate--L-alanine ligase [Raineyella antarctica]|uniref:UDP-N-acetylmuramate--L-alanine ligase n=1 Tax=Raineyella antarctica TaxID=1577474 RepID=A0A1G6GEA3_9ACTN|nr:UDP-N-acetylmuramate--L-alanine ligase [Raineyella antarctica]SDB80163.1 UDP-N-acetylmuramate--L-alanine ligase [Raineyella antarctica]